MPLIFSGPGITSGGICKRTVELVDLYPTIADYAGLTAPGKLDGRSLRPLLSDPAAAWDKPAITQVWHSTKSYGYSIRTERWRYTEWMRGEAGRELYDHDKDPDEIHNLARNPEHKETIARLARRLKTFDHQPR
jgi:uncharacterized sulfatase